MRSQVGTGSTSTFTLPVRSGRASKHPWSWIQRLIRSILEVRRDEWTRPVMKATLGDALKEREKIRRAEWMN